MLIILAGLPGSGKTTLAQALCRRLAAVHVRIDTIEQALRSATGLTDIGAEGYVIGQAIAADNLALGNIVVGDSVNPVAASRRSWRAVAQTASVPMAEIEVVCSDTTEHRRRIETRASDVAGLVKPAWHQVQTRHYEAWEQPPLTVDTAGRDPEIMVDDVIARLKPLLESRKP